MAKSARASLYGSFAFAYSPAATIRSDSYPAHEQIEAGGTGGYI